MNDNDGCGSSPFDVFVFVFSRFVRKSDTIIIIFRVAHEIVFFGKRKFLIIGGLAVLLYSLGFTLC